MNRQDLEYLHNQLYKLSDRLRQEQAPGAITARADGALLAVEWLLKKVKV